MTSALTLREFLGDGARTDGFEDFQAYVQSLRNAYPDAPPEVKRIVRFMKAVSIALVEIANQEEQAASPEETAEILHAMITGTASALTSAVLSVLRDDTPASAVRKILRPTFHAAVEETIRSNGLK